MLECFFYMSNKFLDKFRSWFKRKEAAPWTTLAHEMGTPNVYPNPYVHPTLPPFGISVGIGPAIVKCHECFLKIAILDGEFAEFIYTPSIHKSFDNNIFLCKECFCIKGGETYLPRFIPNYDQSSAYFSCAFCGLQPTSMYIKLNVKDNLFRLILSSCYFCFKDNIGYFPGN